MHVTLYVRAQHVDSSGPIKSEAECTPHHPSVSDKAAVVNSSKVRTSTGRTAADADTAQSNKRARKNEAVAEAAAAPLPQQTSLQRDIQIIDDSEISRAGRKRDLHSIMYNWSTFELGPDNTSEQVLAIQVIEAWGEGKALSTLTPAQRQRMATLALGNEDIIESHCLMWAKRLPLQVMFEPAPASREEIMNRLEVVNCTELLHRLKTLWGNTDDGVNTCLSPEQYNKEVPDNPEDEAPGRRTLEGHCDLRALLVASLAHKYGIV